MLTRAQAFRVPPAFVAAEMAAGTFGYRHVVNESMSDEASSARIEKAVAAVRLWATLCADPQMPDRGSALEVDDLMFPALPTSTVTWFAITSAIDHLGLGADLLRDDDVAVFRPRAFYAVTRSALLGAAQALWVLSGTREERAVRSLLIVEDEASLQRKYVNAYLGDPTFTDDVSEKMLAELHEHEKKLTQRITTVHAELRARDHTGRFTATTMIADIAKHMAPRNNWLRRALMDQWMRGSAAAHSRMWTQHFAKVDDTPLPEGGVIRKVTTSVSDVANAYGTPTLVLSEALDLWKTLRSRPPRRIPPLVTTPLKRPPVH